MAVMMALNQEDYMRAVVGNLVLPAVVLDRVYSDLVELTTGPDSIAGKVLFRQCGFSRPAVKCSGS